MERAFVTAGLHHLIDDDRHLYIVREELDPHTNHETEERQLEEWRDMIHRLQAAERPKRA